MVTVTLQELIAQTNALAEDSALLQLYADTAEEQIEVDINRPLSELATTTQGESGSVTSYHINERVKKIVVKSRGGCPTLFYQNELPCG